MKLIIGLGNPGEEYANTRHNMGFMTLDRFANKHNLEFKLESKFKGLISKVDFNGNKALLLKPLTYMNLSGESIIEVMHYYKISILDILVICDDLDSPLGRIRLRKDGSSGGHNGLKSIEHNCNSNQFKRIKIGIDRSPVIPVIDWVLKKLTKEEIATLEPSFDTAIAAIEDFINDIDFYKIASKYSS